MSFYTYIQNNTRGEFTFTPKRLSHYVIVEADSPAEADTKFEALGGYFDGCDAGMDCHCCGDRWSRADDGDDTPRIYGYDAFTYDEAVCWMRPNPEGFVHYADGRVVPLKLKA